MRPAEEALIVVDMQNDFCPGGALAVAGGDQIVPLINALMDDFAAVILTQDWHPWDHTSFAETHPGSQPFTQIDMAYGKQTLWPRHCVQGSPGAEFHPGLRCDPAQLIVRKGFRRDIDSYSAFFENDRTTSTGLIGYLASRGISSVVLVGLATDYCVAYSALDAARHGLGVTVLEHACRAIDLGGSLAIQRSAMRAAGIKLLL